MRVVKVKISDTKLSEDDIKNSGTFRKNIQAVQKSIMGEFEQGFKGSDFDAGYVKEKCRALANLADLLAAK